MQAKPEYLDELIDRASKKAGSDYKLAKTLKVGRATVSQWKSGKRTCPVGDVVLMAELAGLESEKWAARAIVAQYEGTPKGDMLYRALGKALLATGVALVSSGANAMPIFSIAEKGVVYFIRCIEVLTDRRQHVRV